MEWTTNLPSRPGWYWTWYTADDEGNPGMIDLVRVNWRDVDKGQLFFLTEDDGWWPVDTLEYWIGPLPEPEPPTK